MYSTSLKTWARAVGIDSILIGALVAGVISRAHVRQVNNVVGDKITK